MHGATQHRSARRGGGPAPAGAVVHDDTTAKWFLAQLDRLLLHRRASSPS